MYTVLCKEHRLEVCIYVISCGINNFQKDGVQS